MKRIAYRVLETIDHDILRCRWRRLCAWLLYSDVWEAERDFWDHRIKSLSVRYERESRPHPGFSADQDWYWTPEWQEMKREADEDLAAGRYRVFETLEEFLAALREGRDG